MSAQSNHQILTIDETALLPEPPALIHWKCSTCVDEGLISNWVDSPYDLRRRTLILAGPLNQIVITQVRVARCVGAGAVRATAEFTHDRPDEIVTDDQPTLPRDPTNPAQPR